jgi:uncharacterized membrane protein YgcG
MGHARRWLTVWIIGMLTWLLWVGWPIVPAWATAAIPNPRMQNSWVSDPAQILTAVTERRLDVLLTRLETATTVEMAIVTVPEKIEFETPQAFATELFNTWGVGKADQNNGILMAIFPRDHRVEIVTGREIPPQLSDQELAIFIQSTIVPHFQADQFNQGVWAGTTAIVQHLEPTLVKTVPPWLWSGLGMVTLGGIIILSSGLYRLYHLRQQPVLLPSTGRGSYPSNLSTLSGQLKSLEAEPLARLIQKVGYAPPWPALPIYLIGSGISLLATAIAAGLLVGTDVLYWPIGGDWQLLGLGLLSGLAWLLLWPLQEWACRRSLAVMPYLFTAGLGLAATMTLCLLLLGLGRGLATAFDRPLPPGTLAIAGAMYVAVSNGVVALLSSRDWVGRPRTVFTACCADCQGDIAEVSDRAQLYRWFGYGDATHRQGYRAWYCPQCHPTLSAQAVFLIEAQEPRPKASNLASPQAKPTPRKTNTPTTKPQSTWEPDDIWTGSSSANSDDSGSFGGGVSDGSGAGSDW